MSKEYGFSLIEVLLSIAILSILVGIGAPRYHVLSVRNDLDIAINTIAQKAHRAQVLSEAASSNITWGVYIKSGSITLYKGASYAARDTTADEIALLPTTITPSASTEMLFQKITGTLTAPVSLTLNSTTNESRTISINTKGTVSY